MQNYKIYDIFQFMERPRFLRKEASNAPSPHIKVEDRWNGENPELPFLIDTERLTRLAERDLGFMPFHTKRITLITDKGWGLAINTRAARVAISIGVPDIYAAGIDVKDIAEKAKFKTERFFETNPGLEHVMEKMPEEFLDRYFNSRMIATLSLREALAVSRITLDQAGESSKIKRKQGVAFTASLGFGAAGAYLMNKGYDLLGVYHIFIAMRMSHQEGKLGEKLRNSMPESSEIYQSVHDLLSRSEHDLEKIEEWNDIISFRSLNR